MGNCSALLLSHQQSVRTGGFVIVVRLQVYHRFLVVVLSLKKYKI